jgi:hypothetical protein
MHMLAVAFSRVCKDTNMPTTIPVAPPESCARPIRLSEVMSEPDVIIMTNFVAIGLLVGIGLTLYLPIPFELAALLIESP